MASRLDEIWAKFRRAQEHYDAWNAAIDAWLDRNPYSVRGKPEEGSDWLVVRLVELEEPPFIELALTLSDYFHNLRATLDHLVWHLVDLSGNPTTDATGFPVVKEAKDWGSALGSRLAGFPRVYHGVIKDAQPFNDAPKATSHWLYLLHQYDIVNKHRLLMGLAISHFEWEPTFELNRTAQEGDGREERVPAEPIELVDGAELIRVRAVSPQEDLRVIKLLKVEGVNIGIGPRGDPRVALPVPDPVPDWSGEVERIIRALAPGFG